MSHQIRSIQSLIERRLAEPNPRIQVLVGPRQVGKTTAIRQALAGRGVYFSADSPVPLDADEIVALWHQAMSSPERILAIDEIQKIRGWSEIVKKLWDSGERPKLIVSGSAALAIEKDLRESLAGRFELLRAEHWNFQEAQSVFDVSLEHFIEFGCYPGSMTLIEDRERWGAYIRDSIVEPAIGRDILQLHPVQQPALLRQLFAICVGHLGQIVSLAKLQGQLQDRGALATLQNYLEILGQGFLVSGVQKFTENAVRTRQSPSKLIVHDNALARAFERPISTQPNATRLGHYLENAVGARLIEAGWDTFYWKDRTREVDFVAISPEGKKVAIEVKRQPPSLADLQGLEHFSSNHPDFKPYVVCPARCQIPGIAWWPAEDILSLNRFSKRSAKTT